MNLQPLLVGSTLGEAIITARETVKQARETYPYVAVVALFSGGFDSTTVLHMFGDEIDFAFHANTGIGVEETREFVRSTTSSWNTPLVEKKTDPEWYRSAVIKHGFPGPLAHKTMYINLKERRLREMWREIPHTSGQKVILLSGVRADESQRRMGHAEPMSVDGSFVWVNPIQHFSNWHMHQYEKEFDLPKNPVSPYIHKSGECLCGAYAKREELDELEQWFPKPAAYIHELEVQAKLAGHKQSSTWGWGAYRRRQAKAPGPMCSSCTQIPLLP